MRDWKEELIVDYLELQRERAILEQERAEDQELKNVESTMTKVADALSTLEQPYKDKIDTLTTDIEKIRGIFKENWDIPDNTFKCKIGTATKRTTKSLRISDKPQLIQVLLNLNKLSECIRTWNLSYLRNLKDVGLIEDMIASYDEHPNVVIKGVSDK